MRTSTNANIMREKNKRLILSIIRQREVSRADISHETSLSKPAVSAIIDELIQQGLVKETPATDANVGRRPILLSLKGDSGYFIGVYIGRKECLVGMTDILGKEIVSYRFVTYNNPEKTLDIIVKKIQSFSEIYGSENIFSVSVAVPGPILEDGRVLGNVPNFDGWQGFEIAKYFEDKIPFKVHIMKDANAAAICEMYFGAAKDTLSFVTIMVSNGIGAGIVTNGKINPGFNELGHTSISYNGKLCRCGNKGCLEAYASIPNILKDTEYDSWDMVIENNHEKIIRQEAEYLSCAIVNAVNLYNTDTVILSGGICYKGDKLIGYINEFIKDNTIGKSEIKIKSASVCSKVSVAAAIGIYYFFQ